MTGRIESLWVKRAHRGPMDAVQGMELVAGKGVRGSADQGGKRQVTLIERETWERLEQEIGQTVPPAARRANVLLSGISLANTRGRMLRIGPALVRIAGETMPCERMDEAAQGLREAMRSDWGGGAFAEIVAGGNIQVGDAVGWIEGG